MLKNLNRVSKRAETERVKEAGKRAIFLRKPQPAEPIFTKSKWVFSAYLFRAPMSGIHQSLYFSLKQKNRAVFMHTLISTLNLSSKNGLSTCKIIKIHRVLKRAAWNAIRGGGNLTKLGRFKRDCKQKFRGRKEHVSDLG